MVTCEVSRLAGKSPSGQERQLQVDVASRFRRTSPTCAGHSTESRMAKIRGGSLSRIAERRLRRVQTANEWQTSGRRCVICGVCSEHAPWMDTICCCCCCCCSGGRARVAFAGANPVFFAVTVRIGRAQNRPGGWRAGDLAALGLVKPSREFAELRARVQEHGGVAVSARATSLTRGRLPWQTRRHARHLALASDGPEAQQQICSGLLWTRAASNCGADAVHRESVLRLGLR